MISMELVSMILCYQLLIYIYVMFLGMSRGGGKIASFDALISLLFRKSSFVHDAQLTIYLTPITYRHCPLLSCFKG